SPAPAAARAAPAAPGSARGWRGPPAPPRPRTAAGSPAPPRARTDAPPRLRTAEATWRTWERKLAPHESRVDRRAAPSVARRGALAPDHRTRPHTHAAAAMAGRRPLRPALGRWSSRDAPC